MSKDECLLEDRVRAYVAEFTCLPLHKVSSDTRINLDLGVDGLDAAEFIDGFAQEFGVNKGAFPFHKYFGDEGSMGIFNLFFKRELEGLTVENLIASARAGRWVE